MTHGELMEEQFLLEKAAKHAVFEILQGEGNKIVVQVSHFFKDRPADNWTMTLEKVED